MHHLNDLLKALSGQWYIQLLAIVSSILTIWVSLTLGNKISKDFQVPYFIYSWFTQNGIGYSLDIVGTIEGFDKKTVYVKKELERFLYILNGCYKKLEATTNLPKTIGKPNQFRNGLIVESPDLAKVIDYYLWFPKYLDVDDKAREILDFWRPLLRGRVSTKVIWIFQLSLISYLGGEIQQDWKDEAYSEICKIFLIDLISKGEIGIEDLDKLATAIVFLTPNKKVKNFNNFVENLIRRTATDRRSLESGPTLDFLYEIHQKWIESCKTRRLN